MKLGRNSKLCSQLDLAIMAHSDSSETSPSPNGEKVVDGSHVEQIHTNEKVPGHPGYYEKDGLRTYGDDEDHDHEPKVSAHFA